jgi:hypothetical protein
MDWDKFNAEEVEEIRDILGIGAVEVRTSMGNFTAVVEKV